MGEDLVGLFCLFTALGLLVLLVGLLLMSVSLLADEIREWKTQRLFHQEKVDRWKPPSP